MNRRPDRVTIIVDDLLKDQEIYHGRAFNDLGRLIISYLSPYRWQLIAVLGLLIVSSAIPFALAFTWRFLVDDVLLTGKNILLTALPTAQMNRLVHGAWLFFIINTGIWVFWLASDWLRSFYIQRVGRDIVYDLRKHLHEKLQALPMRYYESNPVGRIISRIMDDVNVIQNWTTGQAVNFFGSSFKIMLGLGTIFFLNWKLAIFVTLMLPFYAVTFVLLRSRIRKTNIALRRLNSSMYALASERFAGIRVVKSFAREKAETMAFSRLVSHSVRITMRQELYSQWLLFIAGCITAVTAGAVVWIGVNEVRDGTMSFGTVLAYLQALWNIFEPVNTITTLMTKMQRLLVVVRRVFNLLDETVDVVPGQANYDTMRGSVVFDAVEFTYPGSHKPVLKDFSISISPGERVAIMGPSGSGKSTLFALVLRFYDPQKGTVSVGDRQLLDVDPRSLRSHVRLVLQEPFIFSGTIEENIRYGNQTATHDGVVSAAKAAQLHEFIISLENGYNTIIGENGISLSGGQKQRLALATALITNPEILLLDDTTSSLDASTEARIRAALSGALTGRTSLIITQRIMTARDCNRIVVMESGVISQSGTHEELMAQEGFYREICRKQGWV